VTVDLAVKKLEKGTPDPPDPSFTPKYRGQPYRTFHISYRVGGKQLQLEATPDGVRHGQVEFVTLVRDDKGGLVNGSTTSVDMDLMPSSQRFRGIRSFRISW
jgi:hypothetical protein